MQVTITLARAKLSPLQKGIRKLVRDTIKDAGVKKLGKASKEQKAKIFKTVKKEWPKVKRKINKDAKK